VRKSFVIETKPVRDSSQLSIGVFFLRLTLGTR
jgi:hypothetical protein